MMKLSKGNKIKLVKEMGMFKNVGELCEVIDVDSDGGVTFKFGNGLHMGYVSADELEKFFVKYYEEPDEEEEVDCDTLFNIIFDRINSLEKRIEDIEDIILEDYDENNCDKVSVDDCTGDCDKCNHDYNYKEIEKFFEDLENDKDIDYNILKSFDNAIVTEILERRLEKLLNKGTGENK